MKRRILVMYCRNCGAELAEDQLYCLKCGVRNGSGKSFCPSCGNAVAEEADICLKCGVMLKKKAQETLGSTYGIKKRSVALAIILSLVTCGVYWIYWFVVLTNEMNKASGKENETSGGVALLLSFVTCGIYDIYWFYKMCQKRAIIENRKPSKGLWVFLAIIGFRIPFISMVLYGLLQSSLNRAIDRDNV